jgi:hypothetical protein
MTVSKYAVLYGLSLSIQAATIRGVVMDPSGEPLPTAQIRALSWPEKSEIAKAASGRDGTYLIEVPRGRYAIESCLTGFLCVTYHPVNVSALDQVSFEFRLPLGPITGDTFAQEFLITGIVRLRGRPAEGYDVCLVRERAASPVCVLTETSGAYKASMPGGLYDLVVASPAGKIIWRKSIDLREVTRLNIEVETQ